MLPEASTKCTVKQIVGNLFSGLAGMTAGWDVRGVGQLNILDRLASEAAFSELSGWKTRIRQRSDCRALTCYMGSEPII